MLNFLYKSDLIGIIGSGLCIVHCLFFPMMFMYHGHNHEQIAGFNFDYVFLIVAALAVYTTAKKKGPLWIKISLWAFLIICLVGIIFHDSSPYLEYSLYLGSSGLIITHIINIRKSKQCC
jgi:hypothetical protein